MSVLQTSNKSGVQGLALNELNSLYIFLNHIPTYLIVKLKENILFAHLGNQFKTVYRNM